MTRLNESSQDDGARIQLNSELSQIVQELNDATDLDIITNQSEIYPESHVAAPMEHVLEDHSDYKLALEAPQLKRVLRSAITRLLGRNAIPFVAMASSSLALINNSGVSHAEAGASHSASRSTLSASLASVKKVPSSHASKPAQTETHEQKLGIAVVVLKEGGSVYGTAEAEIKSGNTDLNLSTEVREIEELNEKGIAKAGGARHLHVGEKLEVPVVLKPTTPTRHIQSRVQNSGTEDVVLKPGDTIWGEAKKRATETGQSVSKIEQEIKDDAENRALIKLDGGVRDLHPGQILEIPITSKSTPTAHHVETIVQKQEILRNEAVYAFKQQLHNRHGLTRAGGSNAVVKSGELILFQDSNTLKFNVATVENVLGQGNERVVVTNKGDCAITRVIEIGDITSQTTQIPLPEQPQQSISTPAPIIKPNPTVITVAPLTPEIPTPADTPVWEINSDPTGAPPAQITGVDNQNANIPLTSNSEQAPLPPSPPPTPAPPKAPPSKNVFKRMIDYSKSPPNLQEVVNNGDVAVLRYVGDPGEGEKLLTPAEVVKDHNKSLAIGLIFEAGARDALGGYAQGVKDGTQALEDELALGVPKYVVTYFAADFDPSEKDLATINRYLAGEESVFVKKGGYTDGVYGGYETVTSALKSGRVKWVIQAYAWSDGKWNPAAQIRQYANHRIVADTTVDLDKGTAAAYARMWLPDKTPGGLIASASSAKPIVPTKPAVSPIPSPNNSQLSPSQIQSFANNPSNTASNPTAPETDTNAQVYNFFNSNGLTPFAAAGIAANANAESGSQPERLEGTPSGDEISINSLSNDQLNNPQIGFGAFQFTPPEKLLTWANTAKLDPNDLITQCKYVLAGMKPSLIQALNAAPNAAAAARIFEKLYERPASLNDSSRRASIAQKLYARMNSAISQVSVPTP